MLEMSERNRSSEETDNLIAGERGIFNNGTGTNHGDIDRMELGNTSTARRDSGPNWELSVRSSAELRNDLALFAEEFSVFRVNTKKSRAKLVALKEVLAAAARRARNQHPELWTPEVAAELQKALKIAERRSSGQVSVV